jgi:MraZ protein
MALSSFDERSRSIQRLIVGHADEVELDAAGRILVPPALRRYAALERRVALVGQGRKLELWDEARWQAQVAKSIAFPGELPPELEGLSL